MLRARLAIVIGLLATGLACDGQPSTAPSGSAPAAASLAIAGPDAVLTGQSASYTATVASADGSTRTVAAVWTSSNPGVASVDGAGRLDGRTHGSTTVTAMFEGYRAAKTVSVVNNYAGTWNGTYVVTACKDSGIFRDGIYGGDKADVPWCQAFDGVGTVHSIALTLSQAGSDYREVRAILSNAAVVGTLTGTVTGDGRLSLAGAVNVLDWYGEPSGELQFSGWDTTADASGRMTGRWTQNLTAIGREGEGRQDVEIAAMTRDPAGVLPVQARRR